MKTERNVFIDEYERTKNGFYYKKIKTEFGEIENQSVPRNMGGNFRTGIFDLYSLQHIYG
ncbi:hypothetical protein [Thermoplasma sp. Kam2015]|uniref:hypothetical protein n=1 Tax=Thermoplasma sp. Kam2015 TaxID=2094122 RepID=UPI001293A21E|nr:hypothetical protein [Thermoplasma sp. Kam2015]